MWLSFSIVLQCCLVTVFAGVLNRRVNLVPTVESTVIELSATDTGVYPRVTNLSDGSFLACYTVVGDGTKTLTVSKSTDGANTFSPLGTIAQSTGDLDNCYVLQLANGNIVAAFRNHDESGGVYTFYRITTSISTDGGATWTFLSQVDQRAATTTNNGLWEPFLRLSRADGSLQAYYASENSAVDQDILMRSSTDNGLTWSATPTTVAGATTTGRDGMPGCSNDAAGTLLCVFETTQTTGNTDSADLNIKSVTSTDEGVTWGDRSQVYIATAAEVEAAAPQIATTTDGALVVSFYTDENDTPDSAFKIITSSTGITGSWGEKTTVATGGASAWPGLLALADGSVLGCAGAVACHMITFS